MMFFQKLRTLFLLPIILLIDACIYAFVVTVLLRMGQKEME